jgi:Glycosyl transferases group 1
MSEERRLWIVGSVPDPIGGVSVTIDRLIRTGNLPMGGLIDPYFSERKSELAIPHHYPKKAGVIAKARVLAGMRKLKASPIFVNGSRPQSILGFAPFLFRRSAPSILLLHHGDLQAAFPENGIMGWAISYALRAYDTIFCLSDKQWSFYAGQGVPGDRLTLIDSYIKPHYPDPAEGLSDAATAALAWADCKSRCVILCSGYATEIYRHDWLLKASRISEIVKSARLIFCCYGPKTDYLERLASEIALADNAKLFFGLSPAEFDAVLGKADVYSRPTGVDSFGIATYDASAKGLTIVASDACERPKGSLLHAKSDFEDYVRMLERACQMWSMGAAGKAAHVVDKAQRRVHIESALRDCLKL